MRYFALLLLFVCMLAVAPLFGQHVTLSEKNASLEKVFREIGKQSGYSFAYTESVLKKAKPITIELKNATLQQAMDGCLDNQLLTYTIIGKTISVKPKEKEPPPGPKENDIAMETRRFEGMVSSENGPVRYASIVVKRTGKSTQCNEVGKFVVENVYLSDTLQISCVGYEMLQLEVNRYREISFIYAVLKVAVNNLDAIQVVAYGTTSQRYATGSIAKLSSEDIAKQPVGNVLQALAGRMAGVLITQSSGLPGGDIQVQVRGQNSIEVSDNTNVIKNLPLYIVDGVPYPAAGINQQASSLVQGAYRYMTGPNGNGSPLASINPNEIESLVVLKDADATALYGSRAANGVIIITTKKGRMGKPVVSIEVSHGGSAVPQKTRVLDIHEYLAVRRQAFKNDGITPTIYNAPELLVWDSTRTTDFQERLVGKTAGFTRANVSLSGGGSGVSFLLSGNYSRQGSIFPDDRGTNTGNALLNLTYTSPTQKLYLAISSQFNTQTINLPGTDASSSAYALPPNYPLYDSTGKLYWAPVSTYLSNPLAVFRQGYVNKTTGWNNSVNLRYTPARGLDLKLNVGYNKIQVNQQITLPTTSVNPEFYFMPSASFAESYTQNLVVEPQLTYERIVAKGLLSLLAGGTYQQSIYEQPFYVQGSNFTSDLYLSNIALAGNISLVNGYNQYRYVSGFGRINYNWDKRYILNLSFRRDGASKFAENKRFGNFGAIGTAWLFSNETWFREKLPWLSYGKLRASYGVVGSDQIPNYAYLATYSPALYAYGDQLSLVPTRASNRDFQWEVTHKLEGALELGVLQDRLLLTLAYFRNRTGNQLLPAYPLSGQSGFSSYTGNSPALVQNDGWEVSVSTRQVNGRNFSWSTAFNLTIPRNKLLRFPDLKKSAFAGTYTLGRPLSSIYAYKFTGLDSAGRPAYQDVNKDGRLVQSISDNLPIGDLVYVGKTYPDAYGGINNILRYKNFQLDALFQFTLGVVRRGLVQNTANPVGNIRNVPAAQIDELKALSPLHYTELYTTSSYNTAFDNIRLSDIYLQKISYARFTNLSLSYGLPQRLLQKIKVSVLRVYVQAQNLFSFMLSGKNYYGMDPESPSASTPPLRTVLAGIQLSL